jgi:peptidylprolyl isomerase
VLRRLLAPLLAVVLGLTGCSAVGAVAPAKAPPQAKVEVTGAAGEQPELKYTAPLTVTRPGTTTVWPGTGDRIEEGGPVLLNLYAEDGRDGSVVQSTFTDAPAWHTMSVLSLGDHLHQALQGQRVGARLLYLEQQHDVPLVLVIDILPTRARGDVVTPSKGLPKVERDRDGRPHVQVRKGAKPPTDLVVQPLVRGSGPQVEVGQVVTVRFTGVRWSNGRQFDTTWDASDGPDAVQSVMIGIGQVVDGWDEGLQEQPVGSQVMLVVPPSLGYGGTSSKLADETLVYVVDILDAHYQVMDESAEGAG